MKMPFIFIVSASLLSSGAAWAVSEANVEAASVVQAKIDREGRSASVAESLRRLQATRDEDEKRVSQIRNLPPECVQEWIDGKLSETDLERLAPEQQSPKEPAASKKVAVSETRRSSLLLALLAVLIAARFYVRQRWRERAGKTETS